MKFIYIDSTNGNDNNDGLTRDTALETILTAITLAETGDVCVMLPSINVYPLANMNYISNAGKDIILVGSGYESILELNEYYSYVVAKNNFVVANCLIRLVPSVSPSYLWNSDDNKTFTKKIYNVIFTKNERGYPNQGYINCGGSAPVSAKNYTFKNCTFQGWLNQYPVMNGWEYIDKCIFEGNQTKGIASRYLPENAVNLAVTSSDFNSDYTISGYPGLGHTNYEALLEDVPEVAPLFLDSLLKVDNQYYSIQKSCYDTETQSYLPFSHADYDNYGFYINDLLKEITINEETFKPIDKFSRFSIVCKTHKPITLYGIKNIAEMAIPTENIDLTVASTIHSITLSSETTANSDIKLAFSFNDFSAQKWYTVTNGALTELNITIPLKDHSLFTETDKQQWNNAKNTILLNGLSIDDFHSLRLHQLSDSLKSIRFAYVLKRPSYEDNVVVQNLEWNFDAKGTMKKMKDSEYDVDLYEHSAKVTTLIENDIIKVNIMI